MSEFTSQLVIANLNYSFPTLFLAHVLHQINVVLAMNVRDRLVAEVINVNQWVNSVVIQE